MYLATLKTFPFPMSNAFFLVRILNIKKWISPTTLHCCLSRLNHTTSLNFMELQSPEEFLKKIHMSLSSSEQPVSSKLTPTATSVLEQCYDHQGCSSAQNIGCHLLKLYYDSKDPIAAVKLFRTPSLNFLFEGKMGLSSTLELMHLMYITGKIINLLSVYNFIKRHPAKDRHVESVADSIYVAGICKSNNKDIFVSHNTLAMLYVALHKVKSNKPVEALSTIESMQKWKEAYLRTEHERCLLNLRVQVYATQNKAAEVTHVLRQAVTLKFSLNSDTFEMVENLTLNAMGARKRQLSRHVFWIKSLNLLNTTTAEEALDALLKKKVRRVSTALRNRSLKQQ